MHGLRLDLTLALRSLARRPGFTAVAVLTLALGIGANTAIFSVVHSVLLRPLPYAEPEQLVRVYSVNPAQGIDHGGLSPADATDYAEGLSAAEYLGVYQYSGLAFTESDQPRDLTTLRVTPGLLTSLGVPPALGRLFRPADTVSGDDRVVVLSHAFWQTELGGDPQVVGRTLGLDGETWTVIGVMPAGFLFPHDGVWMYAPRPYDPAREHREWHSLNAVARLRPGVGLEQAQAEATAMARRIAAEHPETNEGWDVRLVPYLENEVGEVRPALLMLLAAVGFVLLVACGNVANLLLARALGRRREIAVRTALGAGRLRTVRLLVVEALLLAAGGAAGGLLLAGWGVDLLIQAAPYDFPRLEDVSVDGTALAFTLGIALATALITGLLPALRLTRLDPAAALAGGERGATDDRGGRRARGVLTVAEVALSTVLLLGAGLMMRSFLASRAVDLGFQPERLAVLQTFIYGPEFSQPGQRQAFLDRVFAQLGTVPGVESVAAVNAVPMSVIDQGVMPVQVEGRPEPEGQQAAYRVATPGYFDTAGIPLLAGRLLSDADRPDAVEVALLNRTAANRYFPGESPVGRRFRVSGERWHTVVGVIGDIRHEGPETAPVPEVFFPFAQESTGTLSLVVRTGGDPEPLLETLQQRFWQAAPHQSLFKTFPLTELLRDATAERRLYTVLMGAFAALALILAAVGIYGVLAFTVSERTREFGVRMALGARRRQVERLVLGQGAVLVAAGLALGIAGGLALTRLAARLLFGVTPHDPATVVAVGAVLAAVALAACWLPARRAARVEPTTALRNS